MPAIERWRKIGLRLGHGIRNSPRTRLATGSGAQQLREGPLLCGFLSGDP